jgi:hypothetical protein
LRQVGNISYFEQMGVEYSVFTDAHNKLFINNVGSWQLAVGSWQLAVGSFSPLIRFSHSVSSVVLRQGSHLTWATMDPKNSIRN